MCLKTSFFPKVAYMCRRHGDGEKFNINCCIYFLWYMNVHMKQFNYKIHFVELSNKNNYYEMKYKATEIYTKLEKYYISHVCIQTWWKK
jgi:hypothetical protein